MHFRYDLRNTNKTMWNGYIYTQGSKVEFRDRASGGGEGVRV